VYCWPFGASWVLGFLGLENAEKRTQLLIKLGMWVYVYLRKRRPKARIQEGAPVGQKRPKGQDGAKCS